MRLWSQSYFRRLKISCFSFLGWLVITLLSRTLRITRINYKVMDDRDKNGQPIVAAIWHGEQILMIYPHRKLKVTILSSLSADGEILTGILKRFGYTVIRGSSSRGGARALVALIRKIKEGYGALFAVDGPRGPYHKVKPGILYLAEKTGEAIIPVCGRAEHSATFHGSWDKFAIPLPFSRAVLIYGEPIRLTAGLDEGRQHLEEKLTALSRKAEEFFVHKET